VLRAMLGSLCLLPNPARLIVSAYAKKALDEQGKSSKSSGAILPSPRRSGSFLKMPLLDLDSIGTIPVSPVGWGKVDGSPNQKNNYNIIQK